MEEFSTEVASPDSPIHQKSKLNIASIRSTISIINHHLHLLLSDSSALQSLQHRIASRLSSSTKNPNNNHFPFSDHSILSNLFWGVQNLHSSVATDSRRVNDADGDGDVVLSRLAKAESMLQVPALLDENGTTAGVDNRYLVCTSYFYLSLVRKLQGDEWQVAMHFLHALLMSPGYVRMEFTPELCRKLWEESGGGVRLKGGGNDATMDEALRQRGRKCKDWLMYYQVVSYGETPRWIKGSGNFLTVPDDMGRRRTMPTRLQTSLHKMLENAKDSSMVHQDNLQISQEDMALHSMNVSPNNGRGRINGETLSIANLLELQNLDELEEQTSFRRLDEVYYQDRNENFDIKRLQEILEDSQTDDTSDSYSSENDSTEASDIESVPNQAEMDNKANTMVTVATKSEFSSCNNICGRISHEQVATLHECIEIDTDEVPRYSMHIEACSLRKSYLLPDMARNSVTGLNMSILDIRDSYPYHSYKYYLEYATPPGRSPSHDLKCFGHFPTKLLKRYGFSELVPRGNIARRKLDFSSIENKRIGENSDSENNTHIEFMGRFQRAISTLCFSEGLENCKNHLGLEVTTIFEMLNNKSEENYSTLKQQIIYQLLDTISASNEEKFIRVSVLMLLLLISEDKSIFEEIKQKTSYLFDLTKALKTNVHEASILIYMLKPLPSEIKELDILPTIVEIACNSNSQKWESFSPPLSPTAASLGLIEILISSFDFVTNNMHLKAINTPQILTRLVNVTRNKNLEECISLAVILVRCMRQNGKSRNVLLQVDRVDPFLHLLKRKEKHAKSAALEYFHEILRMPRSSAIILLRQIRKHGGISIMHTLFACVQQAKYEHKLLAANILIQLDMLEDPCGKSVFKEEALEVLMEAITSEDRSSLRTLSAFIISNIGGTYSWTGEPYTVAWLVKKVGLTSVYSRNMIKNIDWHDPCLQESEMDTWSSMVAKGFLKIGSSIFNALAKGLESNVKNVSRDTLVTLAWLSCEMTVMTSNTLRYSVCEILLGGIVQFLHPGSDLDERVLACLCVYNFASGKGMQKLMNLSEGVRESLRRLSGVTWMAEELLKLTDYFIPSKERVSCVHTQILEAGKVGSGAATALIYYKGQLYGGYADGSIKIWDIKGQISKLVCEIKEHKKVVTCFTIFEPGDNLLSGSVDKTVRVWQVLQKKFECLEIIEVKEPVQNINTFGERIFVTTQSRGLKVFRSSNVTKMICSSKTVKCLAVAQSKVYLGCSDSSIQGFDVVDNQEQEIRASSNIWRLHNKPISSIYIYKGWLYSAGVNVEESNIKDWRRHNKPQISITLEKGSTVHEMAVVEDFIYLTCSSSPNILQIWLRGKQQKIGRLSAGSKITSLLTTNDVILCGTETGLIKGWIPL